MENSFTIVTRVSQWKPTYEVEKYKLFTGKPLGNTPKTYKPVPKLAFIAPELSNRYNSGSIDVFKALDGTLRYATYRDGCFYPYYGKMVKI